MNFDRQQMLKPTYSVKFSGKEVSAEFKRNITDIEIEESDYEADMARISVMDKDFKFSNQVKLLMKQKAEVVLGYNGKMVIKIVGEVATIEGDFNQEGAPTLVIEIIDNTTTMTKKKKTRKWKNKRASDIAIQLAKEYKFKYSIPQTSTVYDEYTQDDETDAELLQKLADDEGLVFYLIANENKLYFGECIRNPKSLGSLHYNMNDTDILSFQPQLVTKDSPNLVEVKAGDVSSSNAKTYRTTIKAKADTTSHQNTVQQTKGSPVVNGRR